MSAALPASRATAGGDLCSMLATLILFVSLGLDTLAVAVGLGLGGLPRARWVRIGLTFACFEGLMPVVGLLVGAGVSRAAGTAAAYVAAGLLILVGLLAIREARNDDDGDGVDPDIAGRQLLLTGLSVSLDELAVGFSLGVLAVPIGPALAYIGVQAFVVTFVGLALGQRLGTRLGNRAELASGIVLTVLGVALFLSEVLGLSFL